MPWVGLQCVILLFPDHSHLLFEAMTMKNIDSIALFGTFMYFICLTNVHRFNRYEGCYLLQKARVISKEFFKRVIWK